MWNCKTHLGRCCCCWMWGSLETLCDQTKQCRKVTCQVKSLGTQSRTKCIWLILFLFHSSTCCEGSTGIPAWIPFTGKAVPWEARCGEGVYRQPLCNCHSPGEGRGVCTGTCLGKYAKSPGAIISRQVVGPGQKEQLSHKGVLHSLYPDSHGWQW